MVIKMVANPKEYLIKPLSQVIGDELGENVFLCYQCSRCSSGCPLVEHMDIMPNQIMYAAQLNDERVLSSKTIWLCASCQTCTTRCPQDLDVAAIMDTLRIEGNRRGITPAIPNIKKFSNLFLRNIKWFGRLYEIGLMGGMNLWTRQPFKNIDMGLAMLRRGKLKFFPGFVRTPKKVKAVEPADNAIGYYPGCSLHATAAEYHQTILAVTQQLDVKLVEPPGWTCCGSTAAHTSDLSLALELPLQNLALIEQMGLKTVTAPCSACFARMKAADYAVTKNGNLKTHGKTETVSAYQGDVKVQHLLDTLVDNVGLTKIENAVNNPLKGLKVACYYGCLITRPPKVTQSKHPEYPKKMDYLVRALGAEPVEWSYKTECCGGSLGLTQTSLALELSRKIVENAHNCGADVVVAACPLCHINIDARQSQMELDFQLPVLYFTQLMALAFGLGKKQAALNKNIVNPEPLLARYSRSIIQN